MCCHSHHESHAERACGCGGPRREHPFRPHEHHHHPGEPGLGVRRPLRFLAWKLQLEDPQVERLAAILNELKLERAQSEVDDRRALAALAAAVEGETFDAARADEAARLRVASAERVQRQVAESLGAIHALLTPEQRGRLAYLLRTGTLLM